MGNPAAENPPRGFREGTVLSADQLNRVVDMLVRRITGGDGILVRAFRGQLIIDAVGEGRVATVDLKVPADVANWVASAVSLFSEEDGSNPAPLGTYINADGVRVSVETKWG